MNAQTRRPDDIVVGVDTSESARRALRWAANYARTSGRRLRAVHVFRGTAAAGTASTPNAQRGFVIETEIEKSFQDLTPETDWELEFCAGPVGPILVDRSATAQLLVVGTREHTGVDRILGGSVSHYCLSRVQCPLMIIPPPPGRDG